LNVRQANFADIGMVTALNKIINPDAAENP